MKRGVCTTPCGVWKQPQRARLRPQRAVISKANVDAKVWAAPRYAPKLGAVPAMTPPGSPVPTPRAPHPPAAPGWLRDLAGAWVFYSVLPAWPAPTPRFERIARFAPWIGLVLGGLQALLWWALQGRVPPLAQVALVLAAGLWLTGGLHMDGAMDTADGLAAGDRLLEAMDDSRVGASGAQAMALLLLLRAAALASLGAAAPAAAPAALVWAAIAGRLAPLPAIGRFPYLRPGGSAAFHRRHWAGLGRELRPGLVLVVALALLSWRLGLAPLALVGLAGLPAALLVPLWLGRRLGGHSGDSYGACVEWGETLALLLSAAMALVLTAAGGAPAAAG
jgi:adenosylcobinamide-GDP ribazoletransferase